MSNLIEFCFVVKFFPTVPQTSTLVTTILYFLQLRLRSRFNMLEILCQGFNLIPARASREIVRIACVKNQYGAKKKRGRDVSL